MACVYEYSFLLHMLFFRILAISLEGDFPCLGCQTLFSGKMSFGIPSILFYFPEYPCYRLTDQISACIPNEMYYFCISSPPKPTSLFLPFLYS